MTNYPVCNEHVTVFAFTGKMWCSICQKVEKEFLKLHELVATNNDFHFVQLDDSENGVVQWNMKFGIRGVPTILIHDPRNKTLLEYDGNRTADDIARCVRSKDCTGRACEVSPIELVPHHDLKTTSSIAMVMQKHQSESTVTVCQDHPSWIVFTSSTCPACTRAKPVIEDLKTQYPGHVKQLDADGNPGIFNAFQLTSVPAFLYVDPKANTVTKVETQQVMQNNPSLWSNNLAVQEGFVQQTTCPQTTTTMAGACPAMLADCPAMTADCPAMTADCPAMTAEMGLGNDLSLQESVDPQFMAQMFAKRLKDSLCTSLVLEVCRTCPMFMVFTGTNWCTECQMFVSELIKLKQMAACGNFHVSHFDTQLGKDDFNRRVANAFQVANFPTILIFDPRSFAFTKYTGLLHAKVMAASIEHSNKRAGLPQISVPRDISFRVTTPSGSQLAPRYEKRLCARCPSILIFTVHMDKYADVMKANGNEFHVELFDVANADQRQVFDAFKINSLPKVLIYNPVMGNFYVFEGHSKDIPKTAAQAYKHVNGRVWNDYPRIVLQH